MTAAHRNSTHADAGASRRRLRRSLKWLLGSVVAFLVVLALLLGAFGVVVGRVPEYRVQVQEWLSERTGLVIEFRALSARLRLFGPELIFDEAVVRTPDRSHVLATARRGSVAFDIWNSLRNGQLSAGRFSLRSPQISVLRTRDGRLQLLGQSALPQREFEPIPIDLLPTGEFRVTDALVSVHDERTDRAPWSISGVNFDLTRSIGSMRLTGGASLPASLGKTLSFSASADGALDNPHDVVSSFSIAGEELDLSGWSDVLPESWPAPESGRGSLQITGTARGAQLTSLTAHVDFRNLVGQLPQWSLPLPRAEAMPVHTDEPVKDGEAISEQREESPAPGEAATPVAAPANAEIANYSRIALSLSANRIAEEWQVALTELDISRPGSPWRAERIAASWSNQEGSFKASLEADRIVLANLWPLLAFFPESEALANARALRASGSVDTLAAKVERAPEMTVSYTANANLSSLSFAPIRRAPGLSGLSGVLTANELGGRLDLRSRDVRFELPRMFSSPLSARSVEGELTWGVNAEQIVARTEALRVDSADGRALARGSLAIPRDGSSPHLKLFAEGTDLDVATTSRYVPRHRLTAKTLAWFDRAFLAGRVTHATVEIDGPTRSFPYRAGEGSFKADAQIEGGAIEYHEQWHPATDIDAQAAFRNAGMSVRASAARVGEIALTSATVKVADFRQSELHIEAHSVGQLPEVVELLKASPLRDKLDPYLSRIDARGAMDADVRMYFPIKQMERRDIVIVGRVGNASLRYGDTIEPLKSLSGTVTVHNTLFESGELQGRWLDGPVSINVRPLSASSSRLTANGSAMAPALAALTRLPASISTAGEAKWRLATDLASTGRPITRALVNLDLKDFELALPEPVGKRAGTAQDLDVEFTFDEANRVLARASLGDVRALLSVRSRRGEWQLESGGVRADGVAASLPSHKGIRIEGAIKKFVLDDWLALRREGTGSAAPLSSLLQAANVRVERFEMFGYEWADLRGVMQATPSGWRIDVTGPGAAGQILIPEPFGGTVPLRAAMERLVLTKSAAEPAPGASRSVDPRNLPGLDVHIMDTRVHGRSIGAVDVLASRSADGLRFEELRVSGVAARAEGRGHWLMSDAGPYSALTTTLTSSDVASALQALDYTPFLEARHGEIRADLSWQGGFDAKILEVASGSIRVRAENGQIVNLQPGAGRMLGLFSVAALPRRLSLDFSDLTDKGLAFDTIHGDFELREGNAYTNNLLLRGPAAEIGIAGRTGFSARDYDQTAVVTGNLGASLPVAGALAGGPAVGAALLLFSQMFKEPLKGMTRGYYRITGPWDNPTVERVGAADAKDATARSDEQ